MTQATRTTILTTAKKIFAEKGFDGLSMRTLADESGVGLSSIYHFFTDKVVLLKDIFDITNTQLGIERAKLPHRKTASLLLEDRIHFQFEHIEDVVFVLKYFLHYRPHFAHLHRGYVPPKAYLHIEEVLLLGNKTGEFAIAETDIAKEAKVITHAINGFLLEYYPDPPKGRELREVCKSLHLFIMRSLMLTKEVKYEDLKIRTDSRPGKSVLK